MPSMSNCFLSGGGGGGVMFSMLYEFKGFFQGYDPCYFPVIGEETTTLWCRDTILGFIQHRVSGGDAQTVTSCPLHVTISRSSQTRGHTCNSI